MCFTADRVFRHAGGSLYLPLPHPHPPSQETAYLVVALLNISPIAHDPRIRAVATAAFPRNPTLSSIQR